MMAFQTTVMAADGNLLHAERIARHFELGETIPLENMRRTSQVSHKTQNNKPMSRVLLGRSAICSELNGSRFELRRKRTLAACKGRPT